MKVEKIALEGHGVRLEPLCVEHRAGLARAIADGELWTIRETLVPHPDELGAFLEAAEARFAMGTEMAFAIRDLGRGAVVGSTRFMSIATQHRRVEVGFTFLARSAQGTHVNAACKYLMLKQAFESWSAVRVEFLTDARNVKSRAAIARIGAQQEGVLRCHMIMRDGWVRDSVLFAVVLADWHRVKARLAERLTVLGHPT